MFVCSELVSSVVVSLYTCPLSCTDHSYCQEHLALNSAVAFQPLGEIKREDGQRERETNRGLNKLNWCGIKYALFTSTQYKHSQIRTNCKKVLLSLQHLNQLPQLRVSKNTCVVTTNHTLFLYSNKVGLNAGIKVDCNNLDLIQLRSRSGELDQCM